MSNPNRALKTNVTAQGGNTSSSPTSDHGSSSARRISASSCVNNHLTTATLVTAPTRPSATQVRPTSRFSSPSGTQPSSSSANSRPWTPEVGVFRMSPDSDRSSYQSKNSGPRSATSRSPSHRTTSETSSDLVSSGSSRGIPMRRGTQYLHSPPTRGAPCQQIVGGFDWSTPPEQSSSLPSNASSSTTDHGSQQYQSGLTLQMQDHSGGLEDFNVRHQDCGRGRRRDQGQESSNSSQGDPGMGLRSPY
jgi:hypothetical protein